MDAQHVAKIVLQALAIVGMVLAVFLTVRQTNKNKKTEEGKKLWDEQKKHAIYNCIVGFVANFFDTLGIGSYAPTSSAFKIGKSVDDLLIPGTLNVGDTVPVCVEAFLFFDIVKIDQLTLWAMIIAATLGAFFGAGIVTKWNRQTVRLGLGVGLAILGVIMFLRTFQIGPFNIEASAMELRGIKLIIGIVVNFFLGALMNIGVGQYAPCIALVSLLGMDASAAFPIMMGSCAFLMAFGNTPKFVKENRYDMVATYCQMFPGALGAFCAAKFFAHLLDDPKTKKILLVIVIIVVLVTAVMFLIEYNKNKDNVHAND
jgi:uncharacterized membrane protein YfcA